MLEVEQRLTCDVCGEQMRTLKQTVRHGTEIMHIERGAGGISQWRDVCSDCFEPLMKAFWAIKVGGAGVRED